MTSTRSAAILIAGLLLGGVSTSAARPLRALLLSGMNNHDWRSTTPILQNVLEESGMFTVRVLDDPSQCDENSLLDVDVIISNWNNFPSKDRVWGARAEEAILKFVRSGKGFVLVHAASACFPGWGEYQQMIGATWGEKTGHASYHAFNVTVADTGHPVTRVLGDFVTDDELWHRMERGPEARVLCTAYSDTAGGGTGRPEPVAYSTLYGGGRCFYLVLGHDARAMRHPGFRLLLLRGSEWAATGVATIEIPFDIPGMLRNAVAAGLIPEREKTADVERLVQSSSRSITLRTALAKAMAGMLATDAPPAWKKFFCEQLSLIGTADEVPALGRLLADPSLGFPARFALERITDSASASTMRSAAAHATDLPLVGLINAAGEKKDGAGIASLLKPRVLGTDRDSLLAGAALHALGKIGGPEAAEVLANCPAGTNRNLQLLRAESLLRCAEGFESSGRQSDAAALYRLLNVPKEARHVRATAFAGLVRCEPEKAEGMLLEAMKSGDEAMHSAIVYVLRSGNGVPYSALVSERISIVPSKFRPPLYYALADLGEKGVLRDLHRSLSARDGSLRTAAVYGVGRLGDSSSVDRLCALLGRLDASARADVRKALVKLRGDGVDDRLVAALQTKAPPVTKQDVMAVLAARNDRSAVPVLLSIAGKSNGETKIASIKALGALADAQGVGPDLAAMVLRAAAGEERSALANALVLMGRRDSTPENVRNAVLVQLPHSPAEAREHLFRVLSAFGNDEGYQAVKAGLNDPDPAVRTAAIRAFSLWTDSSPLEDLLSAANASESPVDRLLAMQGGIALLEKSTSVSEADRLMIIERELQRTGSIDARRLLVSLLGKQKSLQALSLAASSLTLPGLADEAAIAVCAISRETSKAHPFETRAALSRAMEATHTPAVTSQIRPLLEGLEPQNVNGKQNNGQK